MYEEEGRSNTGVWVGLGLGLTVIVAIGLSVFLSATRKGDPIPAPRAFAAYTAPDKSFVCQRPEGWEKQEASAHAIMSGALFKKGNAKIDITADLQGSLMGDVIGSGNAQLTGMMPPGMNIPKPKPPVEKLHRAGKGMVSKQVSDYKEMPMQTFNSPLGEARYSEWTGEGGFGKGGKLRGYRATILPGERRVTVVCQCPENDWKTLRPAFGRVLGSLAPGSGG